MAKEYVELKVVDQKVWSLEFRDGNELLRFRFEQGDFIRLGEAILELCGQLGIEVIEVERKTNGG